MFAVGAFYLAFEEKILANTESESISSNDSKPSVNARLILGLQVSYVPRSPGSTNTF